MSDNQVSEEGCPFWNTGLRCEAAATTGCPYVHDNFLRKQAHEQQRQANLKKKKGQNLATSRAALQNQYNNVLASKTPNIRNINKAKQITSIKVTNTAEVNSRIESIIKPTSTQVQHSTPQNLNAKIISSMVTKINNLKVDPVTVTKFETIHRLSWATVIYSKPNAQLASKFPKTNSRVCKFFLDTGSCKKGDRCNYTHYLPSPTNPQAPWPGVKHEPDSPEMEVYLETEMPPKFGYRRRCPAPKYSWDVYNKNAPVELQQPKETYAATTSKGVIVPQVAPPRVQHSKTPSQASAATSSQDSVNLSENSWDTTRRSSTTKTQLSGADLWALEIQKPKFVGEPPIYTEKAPASATFHGFPNLPAELRIKIWKMAMKDYKQTARVVWKWDDYHMGNYYRSRLESQNPSPPFLRVSHEARHIAGHYHFEKIFGTMEAAPETWFNFENDRIFLQTESPGKLVKTAQLIIPRERKLVRYLQLPLRDFVHNQSGFVEVVTGFHNLKAIFLIASSAWEDSHWAQNPNMIKKVKIAIQKDWIRRQRKYRPDDMLTIPDVWVDLVSKEEAQVYGVDGILWHGRSS